MSVSMAKKRKPLVPSDPAPTFSASDVEIPSAEDVREIRRKLGLKQHEAAARIGMSRRTWQDYERGKIEITKSAAMLIRMLEAGIL